MWFIAKTKIGEVTYDTFAITSQSKEAVDAFLEAKVQELKEDFFWADTSEPVTYEVQRVDTADLVSTSADFLGAADYVVGV